MVAKVKFTVHSFLCELRDCMQTEMSLNSKQQSPSSIFHSHFLLWTISTNIFQKCRTWTCSITYWWISGSGQVILVKHYLFTLGIACTWLLNRLVSVSLEQTFFFVRRFSCQERTDLVFTVKRSSIYYLEPNLGSTWLRSRQFLFQTFYTQHCSFSLSVILSETLVASWREFNVNWFIMLLRHKSETLWMYSQMLSLRTKYLRFMFKKVTFWMQIIRNLGNRDNSHLRSS